MENCFEVKITSYALSQMQEIVRYISATLHAPESARRWLARTEKEIRSLSHMPERIALTEEEPWHSHGVHKMVMGNYLTYFWIDTENRCVWITALVYGRRDQRQQLEQMNLE